MMTTTTLHDPAKAQEFFAEKLAFTTGPIEVSHQIEQGENISIIDVRDEEDYEKGHLPGALNLPQGRWETFEGLRKDTVNILYCYGPTCHLAAKAAVQFAAQGYPVMEMDGGFEVWKQKQLNV